MLKHETRFRVRYAETDQMGVVYHANYLIWMELGRTEYCRSVGVRYRDMEQEDGILLAVADAHCRFAAPARYDDEITVFTWIAKSGRRMMEFAYEIRNGDGLLLATGDTRHVFLSRDFKAVKLPQRYWAVFGVAGDQR